MDDRLAARWSTPLGRHLRGLVFDYSSTLAPLSEVMEVLRQELEKTTRLGVLYVRLEHWGRMDDMFPWEEIAAVYEGLNGVAREMVGRDLRGMDVPTDLGLQGEGLVVLLSAPRKSESVTAETLDAVTGRVAAGMREHLDRSLDPALSGRITVEVGSGLLERPSEEETFEDVLVRSLVEAEASARAKSAAWLEERAEELGEVLASGGMDVFYQPVVDLAVSGLAGFHTSVGGPPSLDLRYGDVFLDVAGRAGMTYRVYDFYHRRALENALQDLEPDEFLLLQVAGTELVEAAVRVMAVLYGSGARRLGPDNVLFMVEAGSGLDSPVGNVAAFRSAADMGFRLGVDLSTTTAVPLDALEALDPDYLRLRGRTVKNIHKRQDEFELLLMLTRFAARHNMRLITAGCGSAEEINVLRRAGVELVQGEYVGPCVARPDRDEVRVV